MTKLLSPILAELSPNCIQWWCPGCEENHHVPVAPEDNPGSAWSYNGNHDKPTLKPSVLVRGGHYSPLWKKDTSCYCNSKAPDGSEWGFKCKQCHVFITDGQISYLSDCSHHLAGQIVDMVPFRTKND